MAQESQKEEKRNLALIKDYQSDKLNVVDLVAKYRISSTRIYQILDAYDIERTKKRT